MWFVLKQSNANIATRISNLPTYCVHCLDRQKIKINEKDFTNKKSAPLTKVKIILIWFQTKNLPVILVGPKKTDACKPVPLLY